MNRESIHIQRLAVPSMLAFALLVGCSHSDSSQLIEGERTPIRVGLNELFLELQVDQAGFFTIFSEGSEDLVCRILDDSGNTIAEDDDGGLDYNCAITTRLASGQYQVGVSGYEASDRGDVFLTAQALRQQAIETGEVVRIEIDSHAGSVLDFEVARSSAYLISTSGRLDTVCALFNASGEEIAMNDDLGDDLNCGINMRLEPGTYSVVVSGYEAGAGSATFMVSESEIKSYALALDVPQASRLDDAAARVEFDLNITDSGRYRLSTSGSTDTVCELRALDGELMDENDDGDDQNCQITHALPPGDYRFTVSGFAGETGAFTAYLERR